MANRPYKRQNYPDVNATDDELRRYFIDEFQRIENALAPGSLRVNGTLETNRIDCFADGHQYGRQQLVLNVGESADIAGTQEDEYVYINAEEGLEINSSPDNWASGWGGRKTTTVKGNLVNVQGDITASGSITGSASDERLKENITPIPNALDKVEQIRGVTFDWKDGVEEKGLVTTNSHETGVIAQDVQRVIPDAVAPAPFDRQVNEETGETESISGEDYLTVKPEKIIPLLIEAIKELKAQVEELKGT